MKLRVNYHSQPGPQMTERITLDGHEIRVPYPEARGATRTTAVRVRPKTGAWQLGSTFFHTITRRVPQTYTETERYPCGTQRSGFGNSTYTTTRYCTRTHLRTRYVTRTEQEVDGRCSVGFSLNPRVGAMYLLQYDFYAHGQCAARCFEQRPHPDGTFALTPCPNAPPPP